jgi:hypothetical protein
MMVVQETWILPRYIIRLSHFADALSITFCHRWCNNKNIHIVFIKIVYPVVIGQHTVL